MTALACANVNIRVIAQGSSERQIAVVVSKEDGTRALRAAHMAFTLSETTASVAMLGGTGKIGQALGNQIHGQVGMLKEDVGVDICVTSASCSTRMVNSKDSQGLDLTKMSELLTTERGYSWTGLLLRRSNKSHESGCKSSSCYYRLLQHCRSW